MSLKDVEPGHYRAKAIKGAWGKSKEKETPCVAIMFEFENAGIKEQIWWTGYLTDKSYQRTFDNLAILGYKEDKPLEPDANGNPWFGRDYLADKEVDIVIAIEDYEGRSFHKVQWINELGGSRMAGLPVEQVLGNLDLRSEMAAARARMGTPKTQKTETKDELPF